MAERRTPDSEELAGAADGLRALILACERYRQVVAGQLGVGITETQALSHLHVAGALGQTELADRLGITSSAATSLADRLEAAGLATRSEHPHDRRRTIIRLSRAGRTVISRGDRRFRQVLDGLPAGQLGAAAEILGALATGLEQQSDSVRTNARK